MTSAETSNIATSVKSATLIAPPENAGTPRPGVGLSSAQVAAVLAQDGPNAMPNTSAHLLRHALLKFWAPVPWLLEASMILQSVVHKYVEALLIAVLLIFNAVLAFVQKGLSITYCKDL